MRAVSVAAILLVAGCYGVRSPKPATSSEISVPIEIYTGTSSAVCHAFPESGIKVSGSSSGSLCVGKDTVESAITTCARFVYSERIRRYLYAGKCKTLEQ